MISTEQGEEIAKANNMMFYETSAKNGENIKDAFEQISREIIANIDKENSKKKEGAATRDGTNGNMNGSASRG